jgi:hypothetical protein
MGRHVQGEEESGQIEFGGPSYKSYKIISRKAEVQPGLWELWLQQL